MSKQLDKPKQRFYAPSILALFAVVFVAVGLFSLGFWAGTSAMESAQPSRQVNEPFERPLAREMQLPFEKMPEELP